MAGTAADPRRQHRLHAPRSSGSSDLLAAIPALQGLPLVAEQVAQIDSKDMSFEIWRALALRCGHWLAQDDVAGVVITHGTDTLEETAFFLQSRAGAGQAGGADLRHAAGHGAGCRTARRTCVDAVAVAATAGRARRGRGLRRARSTARSTSPSSTPTGSTPSVQATPGRSAMSRKARLRLLRDWPARGCARAGAAGASSPAAARWPRVEIVMSHAGAGAAVVDALVAQGVDGLVVAAHRQRHGAPGLEAALLRGAGAGREGGAGDALCRRAGCWRTPDDSLPDAGGLSPVKARIALMLELLR